MKKFILKNCVILLLCSACIFAFGFVYIINPIAFLVGLLVVCFIGLLNAVIVELERTKSNTPQDSNDDSGSPFGE